VMAEDICDRLESVNRDFPAVLELSAQGGALLTEARARPGLATRLGFWTQTDFSARALPSTAADTGRAVVDEEALPFAEGRFNLVVAAGGLHWVNDLPGLMLQVRRLLHPDGLFIGALFGAGTLRELRECLLAAEAELTGGAAARVSPFADAQDMASLLQRAGFALPVSDVDTRVVRYANPARLLADLRGMGETAALAARPHRYLRPDVIARAIALYAERFADPDGKVRASFNIVTATGWAPHESQQQPLRPGSAKTRLADALGVVERSAGQKSTDS
ncbi:MAG: methyltransferase domain-containing protein, partial [Caulobacterales bacterium]